MGVAGVSQAAAPSADDRPAIEQSVEDGSPRLWPVGVSFLLASIAIYGLIALGLFKLIATIT